MLLDAKTVQAICLLVTQFSITSMEYTAENTVFELPTGEQHTITWITSSYKKYEKTCPNITLLNTGVSPTGIECVTECTKTDKCHGATITHGGSLGDGSVTCRYTTGSIFAHKYGWFESDQCDYYERESICTLTPGVCKRGGKCIPNFEDGSYTCQCESIIHIGTQCEQDRLGYTKAAPAQSCLDVKNGNGDITVEDGNYWLKPDKRILKTYCSF